MKVSRRHVQAATVGLVSILAVFPHALTQAATTPDWSEGARIADGGRSNPFELTPTELSADVRAGRGHALRYPANVTESLIPKRVLDHFFDGFNPLRDLVFSIIPSLRPFKHQDEAFEWLGLHEYPAEEGTGPYFIPFPGGQRPAYRMGYTVIQSQGTQGITISCANCHASDLFGRKVLGLFNRFPRSNVTIEQGKRLAERIGPELLRTVAHASAADARMYRTTRAALTRVETKTPLTLGLDTSLAQVALSLSHREADDYATPSVHFADHPREEPLRHVAADSKPGTWWLLKYKNRWLSDGSVVAGNPIYTNFLWNEIGRGTDLRALEKWFDENESVIRELTTATFSAQAPRYTDFFDASRIDLNRARRGQLVFEQTCTRCHGTYEKAWDRPSSEHLSPVEQLRTTRVRYFARTPVVDVGTDSLRAQGMASLERVLNQLAISRRAGIVIRAGKGYVPPPLEGIWARWPYFHNNSAPSLCAVLTRASERPRAYWAGPAQDRERDFDDECNGYPSGARVPAEWKKEAEYRFDATRPGMTASGHDEGVFLRDGQELLTREEKSDLIVFLKTL